MSNIKNKQDEKNTSLNISHDVIATIAKQTVMEIEGVTGLANFPASIKDWMYKNTATKSILITLADEVAVIDISIVIAFGYNVKDVSEKVQMQVKDAVQNMTGITVSKVNVYVANVDFDNENK